MSYLSVQGNPFTEAEVVALQALAAGGSTAPEWGGIGGVLSDQTDLQSALDGKADDLGADDNYVTDAEKVKLGYISITQAVDLDTIETRVNALDAAVVLQGGWDASAGTFPGGGTAQAGYSYIVTVAGTVDGVSFSVNDRLLAIVDNASTGTYASNWLKLDYTDQVLSVNGLTGAIDLSAVYQPLDSDLTAIAALTPSNDDFLQRKAGAWVNRTIAQVQADLGAGSGATTALDNLAAVAINAALVLGVSDAFALGSTTKQWSDLFLAEGGVINWDNGDFTITQSGDALTLDGGATVVNIVTTASTAALIVSSTNAGANGAFIQVYHNSASPLAADALGGLEFYGNNSSAAKSLYGYIYGYNEDPAAGSIDGSIVFALTINNTLAEKMKLLGSVLSPVTSDGLALGSTSLQWSDLFLASGGVINFANGDVLLTHSSNLLTVSGGQLKATTATPISLITDYPILVEQTDAGAFGSFIATYHNSASPAANDIIGGLDMWGKDSAGNVTQYAYVNTVILDPTNTSEDSKIIFAVTTAGTLANELELNGASLYPTTNDGLALGTSSLSFADLFLASGGVINFNNGNATITHSAGAITSNVDISVPDEAYDATNWNGSLEVPTKNAVRDKIESMGGGTWDLIGQAQLASSNATAIDISSISSNYDAFRITYHLINASAGDVQARLRFNADTGSNYETAEMYGDSGTLSGFRRTAEAHYRMQGASNSFNSSGGEQVISGVLLVTKPLSGQYALISGSAVHWDATEIKVQGLVGRWTNTSSKISQITIDISANSYATGSWVLIEGRIIT